MTNKFAYRTSDGQLRIQIGVWRGKDSIILSQVEDAPPENEGTIYAHAVHELELNSDHEKLSVMMQKAEIVELRDALTEYLGELGDDQKQETTCFFGGRI